MRSRRKATEQLADERARGHSVSAALGRKRLGQILAGQGRVGAAADEAAAYQRRGFSAARDLSGLETGAPTFSWPRRGADRAGRTGDVGLPELLAPGQDAAKLASYMRSTSDPGYIFANALGRV